MLVAFIPPPPVQEFSIGPLDIRVYGILIATGVLLAVTILRRRYARFGGDVELADRVAFYAIVAGFLGARIGYVIPRIDRFVDDPASLLAIWEGGLALYGGLTVGLITVVVLLRRWGGDLYAFGDALAPAVPAAQAIGRWGNYFNQELYGTPTDVPWAVEIEPQFRVAEYAEFSTFHPTFLYESIGNIVLVGVILGVERWGRLRKGSLLLVYAIGYGILRFSLELIRTDTTWRLLGLSRNGWVSLLFIVAGSAVLYWHNTRSLPAEPEGEGAAADAEVDSAGGEAADTKGDAEAGAEPSDESEVTS